MKAKPLIFLLACLLLPLLAGCQNTNAPTRITQTKTASPTAFELLTPITATPLPTSTATMTPSPTATPLALPPQGSLSGIQAFCDQAFTASATGGTPPLPLAFFMQQTDAADESWQPLAAAGLADPVPHFSAFAGDAVQAVVCIRQSVEVAAADISGVVRQRYIWQVRVANWQDGTVINALEFVGEAPQRASVDAPTETLVVGEAPYKALMQWLTAVSKLPPIIHTGGLPVMQVLADVENSRILGIAASGSLMEWHMHTTAMTGLRQCWQGQADQVALSARGDWLAYQQAGQVFVLNLLDDSRQVFTADQPIVALGFSADGSHFYILHTGGISLWRLGDATLLYSDERLITAFDLNQDGSRFALALADGRLEVWQSDLPQQTLSLPGDGFGVVQDVVLANDGLHVAAVDENGRVSIWQLPAGDVLTSFNTQKHITALAFSSNARWLVGTDGLEIYLWDLQQAGALTVLRGHTRLITTVRFTSDERMLVSASLDGTLRLWELPK